MRTGNSVAGLPGICRDVRSVLDNSPLVPTINPNIAAVCIYYILGTSEDLT